MNLKECGWKILRNNFPTAFYKRESDNKDLNRDIIAKYSAITFYSRKGKK